MNYKQIEKRILALVEEINPGIEVSSEEIDKATNRFISEIARIEKNVKCVETAIGESIPKQGKGKIYKVNNKGGKKHISIDDGADYEIDEETVADQELYKPHKKIKKKNKGNFVIRFDNQIAKQMPYVIAADLLGKDTTELNEKYEGILQCIDTHYINL